jgi:Flp pilus assembly protein TadD
MPRTESTIAAAEACYRGGDYSAAVALLENLVDQDPAQAAVLRILGLCRLQLHEPVEALGLLERAHALAPHDPWTQMHYGIGLQSVGRHKEAVAVFRTSQAKLPNDPAPLLNISSSLLALGNVPGAIRAARRGRLRAPAMADAHYILGLAYLTADWLNCAAQSFRIATRLAPGSANAWVSLGVARYRKGEIEGAKQAMRVALEVDPGNESAAANLGGFLKLSGEVEVAETVLRGVVERAPNAFAARINLAADLLQEDRAEEALSLLEGTTPTDPGMRQHWLLQKVLALIKLSRLLEARDMLDSVGAVPPGLEPLIQWREVMLSLEAKDDAQARRQATAMETMLTMTASMLPEHRIMGHFDAAKFWTRQREPDRAFPNWISGHRLLARFQPFSRRDFAAFADTTIAAFDAARLAHGPRASNLDQTPVFVVGMPRSGTTLVEQILSAHHEITGAGERTALGETFFRLGGNPESPGAVRKVAALDSAALDLAAQKYLADLHAIDARSTRIVDKMPGNFKHLGLMALMLPGARVIACDRDPRDIGLSIFTFRFYGLHAYAHDLSDLGWYIGQQRRLMAHWHAVLPNPILTIRLRDWIEDFSGTLRKLLDFLGLPYDKACEDFHAVRRRVRTVSRMQVQERVHARGLGRWREYEHHLMPLITALEESNAFEEASIH